MKKNKLQEYILSHVTRDGACGFGVKETIDARNVQDFINLLKSPKGVEHCMQFRFPEKTVLEKYKSELEDNRVYVSGNHGIKNPRLVIAFGGKVNIIVDGYGVCEVYATNDATISVQARDNALVFVELHHDSKLTSEVFGKANVNEFRK